MSSVRPRRLFALLLLLAAASACETAAPSPAGTPSAPNEGSSMPLTLTSSAFTQGNPIPRRYTCDDQNVSPPLQWGEPPAGTQSFALIADDPDAPGGAWVHWVVFNIPAAARSLPEAVPATASLPDGTRQGRSDFGQPGYGGPCPPSGTHRYFFKLYALDTTRPLPDNPTKAQLLTAMEGHVLGQGELMGTYHR